MKVVGVVAKAAVMKNTAEHVFEVVRVARRAAPKGDCEMLEQAHAILSDLAEGLEGAGFVIVAKDEETMRAVAEALQTTESPGD